MKSLKLLVASSVLMLSLVGAIYSQKSAEAVDDFISKQAKENIVKEYKDVREVLRGDVNGDGKDDLIVLYTLDGFKTSPGYIKYLAVFLWRGAKFQYANSRAVSGIIERLIELKSIARRTISLETLEYLESGENHYRIVSKVHFILTGKRLKEI